MTHANASTIIALLILTGTFCLPVRGENNNGYEVYRVPVTPVIDGKLDDETWTYTPVRTGFTRLNHPDMFMDPRWQTEVRMGYDDKALYIGIIAHEPRLKEHVTHARKKETGKANWQYQLVEWLLDPKGADGGEHYHFAVDILGHSIALKADLAGKPYDMRKTKWKETDDNGWTYVVGRAGDRFVVEAALRFAALGGAPAPGDVWRAQVGRHGVWTHDGLHWRLCSWSEMFVSPEGYWKQVAQHGSLTFMPEVLIPDGQNVGKRSERMNRTYVEWKLTQGEAMAKIRALVERIGDAPNLVHPKLPGNKLVATADGTEHRMFVPATKPAPKFHRGWSMSFAEHPDAFLLTWEKPVTFNCMVVEWYSASAVGSDYSLEILDGDTWKTVCSDKDNTLPENAHQFDLVKTKQARLTVYAKRATMNSFLTVRSLDLYQLSE